MWCTTTSSTLQESPNNYARGQARREEETESADLGVPTLWVDLGETEALLPQEARWLSQRLADFADLLEQDGEK